MGFPTIWLLLAMAPGAQFPGMNVAEPAQASVANVSKRPFDVEFGGDYHGGSRRNEFSAPGVRLGANEDPRHA